MLTRSALFLGAALFASGLTSVKESLSPIFINAARAETTLETNNINISTRIITALHRFNFEKAADLSREAMADQENPAPLIASLVAVTEAIKDRDKGAVISILQRQTTEPQTRLEMFMDAALESMREGYLGDEDAFTSHQWEIWHRSLLLTTRAIPATLAMTGEIASDDSRHPLMDQIVYLYNGLIEGTEYPHFRLIDMPPK